MLRVRSLFFALLCSFFFTYAFADPAVPADGTLNNTINVGAAGVKRIRIALPAFVVTENSAVVSAADLVSYHDRFQSLLDFTNWFDVIPPQAYVSANAALSPFKASEWSLIKADYVLFARIVPVYKKGLEDGFHLELRLYDVQTQNMLVGKVYSNINKSMVDMTLRRFGDVMIQALTGSYGPFMSQIVFVGRSDLNAKFSQIYVADFDGKNARPIGKNKALNMSPSWSPSGTKITYTSFINNKPEIYQYNLLTNKTTKMTSGPGNKSGSNWAPSGRTIAYSATTPQGETHIFSMNEFGGDVKPLSEASSIEVEPAFSPDGKYLAFTSNRYGKPMLFLKELASGNILRLTYAGWYNASAAWSPDSSTIAFASYDRDIDRWDLFKILVDGTKLERLTVNQGDNEKPTWSPDGRFILFQSARGTPTGNTIGGAHKLYVMSKEGSFQKQLNMNILDVRQPAWGPRLDVFQVP
jgi:TolB protein